MKRARIWKNLEIRFDLHRYRLPHQVLDLPIIWQQDFHCCKRDTLTNLLFFCPTLQFDFHSFISNPS
jgi:hypothetical protein